jgi:hypothetical protein
MEWSAVHYIQQNQNKLQSKPPMKSDYTGQSAAAVRGAPHKVSNLTH